MAGGVKKLNMTKALSLGIALFLVVLALLIYPYYHALANATKFASDVKNIHLLEMFERQRTIVNIEKLNHYATIILDNKDPDARRKNLLSAFVLTADASFERDRDISDAAKLSFEEIKKIAQLRNGQDSVAANLMAREGKAHREIESAIMFAAPNPSDPVAQAVRLAVVARLSKLSTDLDKVEDCTELKSLEALDDNCRATLASIDGLAGRIPGGLDLKNISADIAAMTALKTDYLKIEREVKSLRSQLDERLENLSEKASKVSRVTALEIAERMENDSKRVVRYFLPGLGLVFLLLLLMSVLLRQYIIKPILISTKGLKNLEEEGTVQKLPPTRIFEMQAILNAVESLSKVLKDQKDANAHLEERVRERTKELERAKVQLEKDIEARAKAEAELRESEERFRGLLGAWPDPTIIRDPDGMVTYVNDAFVAAYGYQREEVLGGPLSLIFSEEEHKPANGEALQAKRKTKDGRQLTVNINSAAFLGSRGEEVANITIHRDVTRQVEMEAYLIQAEKLQAVGTLAGGIAHDFNNILAVILGFAQFSQSINQNRDVKENLDEIITATRRASDLVKQILAFSHKEENRQVCKIQLKAILKEVTKLLRATIPASVKISSDVRSDSAIAASPADIHRIIVNLCTNSSLAMANQCGTITIKVEEANIGSEFTNIYPDLAVGRYVKLSVTDTGCGMTPEVKQRIFEPFFTTRLKSGGTGMGLSVVHGIVKRLKGAIFCESEPGRGTVFEILFPVEDELPEAAGSPDEEGALGGTERILLVDDEPGIIRSTKPALEQLGYRVTSTTLPVEALEIFVKAPGDFDLVITDMTMPLMTADVLTARMREARPDIPVIICTGFSNVMTKENVELMGINALLSKPVSISALTRAIRDVVGGR